MEQTAYEIAAEWLKNHEFCSYDNGHSLGVVNLEDALRAIRLGLTTYTNLLNPDTNVKVLNENLE